MTKNVIKMQKLRLLLLVIISLVLVVTVAACGGQSGGGKKVMLNMGTTSTSSGSYAYFAAIAQSINNALANVQVTPVESGASVDNLNRIMAGEFEMGLSGHTSAYENYYGTGDFKDKKNDKLRILWAWGILPTTTVARKDSGITSLGQLDGKKFSPGGNGSGTESMMLNVFSVLGIKPDYYRGSFDDAAQAVQDRQIVGMTKNAAGKAIPDSLISQVLTTTELNIIGFTQEEINKIKAKAPYYVAVEVPPNVYKGQSKSFKTFGLASYVVGASDLSPDLVYNMTKAVFDDQERQAASFTSVAADKWDYPQGTIDTATLPLHAGVVRLLEERGYKVPAEFIPPEYKK